MSADEEFGRLVGDRLRDEVADLYADKDLARVVRKRLTRRRTWTIGASIGAPLIAAAAAVAVVVSTGTVAPEKPQVDAAPPTTTQPRVENLAHVQDMTIQALRSVEEYVIHEKNLLSSGYDESWTDRATERYRMDAYSRIDGPMRLTRSIAGKGRLGDLHYVYVDYDRKTWHAFHDTEPPPPLEVPDILDADALKKAIDEGRMELIGAENIDGRDTHHLRLFATIRGYQIDLWVDSTSYLPVRETSTVIGGPDEPVMTSEYTWLPRTEENLAKVELTPPPDFTKE